jgi:hypothetical protein
LAFVNIYIYIYIERERERERDGCFLHGVRERERGGCLFSRCEREAEKIVVADDIIYAKII